MAWLPFFGGIHWEVKLDKEKKKKDKEKDVASKVVTTIKEKGGEKASHADEFNQRKEASRQRQKGFKERKGRWSLSKLALFRRDKKDKSITPPVRIERDEKRKELEKLNNLWDELTGAEIIELDYYQNLINRSLVKADNEGLNKVKFLINPDG